MEIQDGLYTKKYILKRLRLKGLFIYLQSKLKGKRFHFNRYCDQYYYPQLSEEKYEAELKEWYHVWTGRSGNLIDHPVTLNDKIQWMKLHDNTPLKALCADKYRVRSYIDSLSINNLKQIPLLGCWEDSSDIDFSSLPDTFVLKLNAGCRKNLFVRDKSHLNISKTRRKLSKWLANPYGWDGLELQYVNTRRCIIAEELIQQKNGELLEFKFFCFHGTPQLIEVIGNRDHEKKTALSQFLDTSWNPVNYHTRTYSIYSETIPKPENLDDMLEIAGYLSSPFLFVRIDLYDLDGDIFFGEFSFTPSNGRAKWDPPEADKMLGELLHLPTDLSR